jgi:hypothetical protein
MDAPLDRLTASKWDTAPRRDELDPKRSQSHRNPPDWLVVLGTHQLLKSSLNALAFRNMLPMSVTWLTSHELISPLNAAAPLNMPPMFVTLLTSHEPMFCLNTAILVLRFSP